MRAERREWIRRRESSLRPGGMVPKRVGPSKEEGRVQREGRRERERERERDKRQERAELRQERQKAHHKS